jgi:hypothetical protein
MVVGASLGAWVGWRLAEYQEGPWAGGVIGAGIGLSVGGLFLGFRRWRWDGDAELKFPSTLSFLFPSGPR